MIRVVWIVYLTAELPNEAPLPGQWKWCHSSTGGGRRMSWNASREGCRSRKSPSQRIHWTLCWFSICKLAICKVMQQWWISLASRCSALLDVTFFLSAELKGYKQYYLIPTTHWRTTTGEWRRAESAPCGGKEATDVTINSSAHFSQDHFNQRLYWYWTQMPSGSAMSKQAL